MSIVLGLVLSCNGLAQESRDPYFVQAREAFRAGDRIRLERASQQLGSHELAPYVENYHLRMFMEQDDGSAISEFLVRYDKTYVAEKLRADWLRWMGKRQRWTDLEAEYARLIAPEPDVVCLNQQARWQREDPAVLTEVRQIWLQTSELAEPCKALFDVLVARAEVTVDDIWLRAHRLAEANRPGALRATLAYLPLSQEPDGRQLDSALNQAMSFLARHGAALSNRTARELLALAIQRLASNDPGVAARELQKWQDRLQASERQWAWSQIGLQAAKKHMPEALVWYAQAGNTPLSDEGAAWKVRAALRAQDWGVVAAAISAMPSPQAVQPEWVYWLGRANKAGGRSTEAAALFEKIAGQANFYGNLADEELGRTIAVAPKPRPLTVDEEKQAKINAGLQRALAFFRLDMRTEGVREWNWSLRGMDDRQLLAAADLARRHQIWDRAINTADKTQREHDFNLRFLAPFSQQVRSAAQQQALDDAWVYGLMRQESRFITSAKSNVGASGLMQLMPATAKWVAKKIGLRDFHPSRVNDMETNVLLGTSYMRLVMENLDNHPVLASAAYNAGPGRARKWRAEQALEGAIYAETIPFSETRDYVKKVMSNAVYYTAVFTGRPDSLKARLGTIGPRQSEYQKDADLP